MIKKALTIAAVALAIPLAAPRAEAGHSSLSITYRSGNASCGCPSYTRRNFRGYDSCRRPIFNYSRLAVRHGSSCRHHAVQRRTYVRDHGNRYQRGNRQYGYARGHGNRQASRGYSRGYGRGQTCR